MVDVFLAQHLDGPLGSTGKLLFDIDVGIIPCNVLILNVNILPGQTEDLAHSHGAGKCEIHGHIKFPIVAVVKSLPNRFRIPHSINARDRGLHPVIDDNAPLDAELQIGFFRQHRVRATPMASTTISA